MASQVAAPVAMIGQVRFAENLCACEFEQQIIDGR